MATCEWKHGADRPVFGGRTRGRHFSENSETHSKQMWIEMQVGETGYFRAEVWRTFRVRFARQTVWRAGCELVGAVNRRASAAHSALTARSALSAQIGWISLRVWPGQAGTDGPEVFSGGGGVGGRRRTTLVGRPRVGFSHFEVQSRGSAREGGGGAPDRLSAGQTTAGHRLDSGWTRASRWVVDLFGSRRRRRRTIPGTQVQLVPGGKRVMGFDGELLSLCFLFVSSFL